MNISLSLSPQAQAQAQAACNLQSHVRNLDCDTRHCSRWPRVKCKKDLPVLFPRHTLYGVQSNSVGPAGGRFKLPVQWHLQASPTQRQRQGVPFPAKTFHDHCHYHCQAQSSIRNPSRPRMWFDRSGDAVFDCGSQLGKMCPCLVHCVAREGRTRVMHDVSPILPLSDERDLFLPLSPLSLPSVQEASATFLFHV